MQVLYENVMFYCGFYIRSFWYFWNNLQPMQYGMILSVVAVTGWWMMRFKKGHG